MKPRDRALFVGFMRNGVSGACVAGYPKGEFRRVSKVLLKDVAVLLGLPKESYEIRFNESGNATSGECSMVAQGFYVCIEATIRGHGIMYRTNDPTDKYGAGMRNPNRWFPVNDDFCVEAFAAALGQLLRRANEVHA
jgi:hypothetical protein